MTAEPQTVKGHGWVAPFLDECHTSCELVEFQDDGGKFVATYGYLNMDLVCFRMEMHSRRGKKLVKTREAVCEGHAIILRNFDDDGEVVGEEQFTAIHSPQDVLNANVACQGAVLGPLDG